MDHRREPKVRSDGSSSVRALSDFALVALFLFISCISPSSPLLSVFSLNSSRSHPYPSLSLSFEPPSKYVSSLSPDHSLALPSLILLSPPPLTPPLNYVAGRPVLDSRHVQSPRGITGLFSVTYSYFSLFFVLAGCVILCLLTPWAD